MDPALRIKVCRREVQEPLTRNFKSIFLKTMFSKSRYTIAKNLLNQFSIFQKYFIDYELNECMNVCNLKKKNYFIDFLATFSGKKRRKSSTFFSRHDFNILK